jgi:hypothetical protein
MRIARDDKWNKAAAFFGLQFVKLLRDSIRHKYFDQRKS